ncbi:MAG: transposase [Candidatus Nealsonbacteria bacterium]|nr:transposase [Candidatus Nealsonbacteria bacterium]
MPIKRPPLSNGEIYHIVIRAIEGLKLFREEKDNFRMVHDLFEFNNEVSVLSSFRNTVNRSRTVLDSLPRERREPRKLLVEILAFCLMPNHVHLLVRQLKDGGISKFMRKIGAGYGGYYNKKYQRSGHLFQGKYRIVHVKDDRQLLTVFVYIHTNPVAIICPKWKEEGIKIKDLNKVIQFLEEQYRWSSYPDYLGNKNFPSVTSREFLLETIGEIREAKRFVNDWLQHKKELADYKEVAIE